MLVDNPPQQSPFTFNPSEMSDFFNMDLINGGQGQGSTSSGSRASTPPVPSPTSAFLPTIAESSTSDFFNFYLDDEYIKADPLAPPPVTGAPFDFFDVYSNSNSSPDSGSVSGGPSPPFAIDPQLMATPATSKGSSDFGDDEKQEHEEEDEDEESVAAPQPVKVGGKGKARKGTVQSGGVQKKAPLSSVVKDKDDNDDVEDWRPSPEEYKKMSSKEKRQLRNKISARNFRVRRKEYITTLEGDIAERDRLIDAIRSELGTSQSENRALRQEITALKKALLAGAGRSDSPVLPPPGPLPAPAAARPPSSPLITPNTQKDLPSSPRFGSSSKAFWGGSSPFGGVTPVHTTLIPESFAQPLAGVKPLAGGRTRSPLLQENINPALNNSITSGLAAAPFGPGSPAPFDTFADSNMFTMKMLDAYRMQLWTRMGQQQQQLQAQQAAPHAPITGLASNLRPHYFSSTSRTSGTLSTILSGKHSSTSAASAYPTPPSSPKLGSSPAPFNKDLPTAQQAVLATMASQTLFQRLGSAFWEAFSGSSSSTASHSTSARAPSWDSDKIRRVLEGKAVVKVVDIEPEEKVRPAPAPAPVARETEGNLMNVKRCMMDLEEGVRALSLAKK